MKIWMASMILKGKKEKIERKNTYSDKPCQFSHHTSLQKEEDNVKIPTTR
jgi:hypothetical protein